MSDADLKTFATRDFRLQDGGVLPEVTISYRTLGTLAPDRSNAVLITHGNTSGPQMIDPGGSTGEGSWNEIVGPGKAVDTNRFFAICPNMLGSSYGSTNGASIDPRTNAPYGPRFPDITVSDIVGTQRLLIDQLVEFRVVVTGIVAFRVAHVVLVEDHIGLVDGIAEHIEAHDVILADQLRHPIGRFHQVELAVDPYFLELVEQ